MRQLDWDPEVDASAVGIAAKNGTVTLTGYINSYSGKLAAERAAKRVRGVRAVANDIEVRLKLARVDSDIAADVVHALELRSTIPDGVQAALHNGHVTLTGKVNWVFQKRDAEKAVRHIRGVRDVVITSSSRRGPRNATSVTALSRRCTGTRTLMLVTSRLPWPETRRS
jgi:osmotically-inducible protein OsmY